MKFAMIDGISVTSMEDIHNILAQQLEFPAWYGGNLDALHDCLTELHEMPPESEIILAQESIV